MTEDAEDSLSQLPLQLWRKHETYVVLDMRRSRALSLEWITSSIQ